MKLRNRFFARTSRHVDWRRKVWMTSSNKASLCDIIICWCCGSNKNFLEKEKLVCLHRDDREIPQKTNFDATFRDQKRVSETPSRYFKHSTTWETFNCSCRSYNFFFFLKRLSHKPAITSYLSLSPERLERDEISIASLGNNLITQNWSAELTDWYVHGKQLKLIYMRSWIDSIMVST